MIRLAAFLVFCVGAALLSRWLSAQEGVTVINWLGWRVEVMTSLLIAGLVLGLGVLFLLFRLIATLLSWPSWLGHNWRARRRRRGEHALGQGMVAFAAGDMKEARKLARRAEKLLGSAVLPDLLSAQTAHATGDDKAALRYFKSLSAQDDTAYFGHLGLMRLYLGQGESEKSCAAARAALALKDKSAPAHLVLLAEDLNRENWKSALDRLAVLLAQTKNKAADTPFLASDIAHFASGQLNYPELLAAHLCLRLAERSDDDALQTKYLNEALRWSPQFLEATVRLAQQERTSSPRKALKRVEAAFKAAPHARLAGLIADLSDDNDGQLIARLSALADQAADPDEARLLVAQAALDKGIWASASAALEAVSAQGRTNQYFLLTAELSASRAKSLGQEPDSRSVAEREGALLAAAHAPRTRRWQCGGCGTVLPQWQMVCPSCSVLGQIDQMSAGRTPLPGLADTPAQS